MIKIGVTENVYLFGAVKNDKGTLEITFNESANAGEVKKTSLLDQFSESSDTSGNKVGSTFLLFMPSMEMQNEAIPPEKLVANMMKFKNQLHHILKRYVPENQIKWDPLKGIMIKTEQDLLNQVTNKDTYTKMYTNIADQFIEQVAKFKANDPAKLSRIFCIRTSKEKSYNRLRDNFLNDRPFWETMDIPKAQSKMWVKASNATTKFFEADTDGYVPKFDDYEIKQGLDNPIPSASKPDAPQNTPEEVAAVNNVFGQQPAEAIDFSAPQFGAPAEPSPVPGLTSEPTPTVENGGLGEGVQEGA